MGKINELLCDYLGRPEYYADFWNGTEFGGKSRIQSKLLTRHDREYHKSQWKPIPTSSVRRDVQMQYRDINEFILGVEVMETVEYTMPVRIMDCDGAQSILEMTGYENFFSDLKGLFQNYSIKVYQLKDLIEENYQTSLREIIAIFKRCRDREAVKKYYLEHTERFQQLDELSIDTLGALIGNSKLKMFRQENGGLDMCKAFEDERLEGRLEGERIGIERGEENLRQAIKNLMNNLKLSSVQALEALGIPQNEWEKYMQV